MALVPKDFMTDVSIRCPKFTLEACCPICMEVFDTTSHTPKVLECGHSFCMSCIKRTVESIQVSHTGNGDVDMAFCCSLCRRSMSIPSTGVSGFPTNHQLIDAIAPQDSRVMTCTSCRLNGSETTFHICRECTITNHNFDIKAIIGDDEPPVHPDDFTICSTCVLKNHNNPCHNVVAYVPIRIHYQFKRNMRSVDVLKAQMAEKSADARLILTTMLERVGRNDTEVDKMVALMEKAKSSERLDLIFKKYTHEMSSNIKLLDVLIKDGGKLKELVTEKTKFLEKGNEEISSMHCFAEPSNLKEVLNFSDVIPSQIPTDLPDIVDTFQTDTELPSEEANLPRRVASQRSLLLNEQIPTIEVIQSDINEETFWNIVLSTSEVIWFNVGRLWQTMSHGTSTALQRNNYNQESVQINIYEGITLMITGAIVAVLAFAVYSFWF
ncbi:hypothetical protein GCK72_002170 [Caenorhabditis remanei]|uniref:RING-type domain-containing protein n=1 Tax=Caenorhabditis remanei TaxID=31234 RepID=A0A6A5HWV2_CAERE|nr:hypothetical protein GCK72_002170 [Caenorhabditis remanei]KAF1770352.1 hypothetical protein GCK72_002170 [Caenorhabditis remanei]